uniref:Uncharacterized protein n=1 Tax=Megaselia scalaris TaxID=36166 RepID=T1H675_MEGSC
MASIQNCTPTDEAK